MEQKNVLITGASRGIGKSAALLFASRGYHVFLNCRTSVDELQKLKYTKPYMAVPAIFYRLISAIQMRSMQCFKKFTIPGMLWMY